MFDVLFVIVFFAVPVSIGTAAGWYMLRSWRETYPPAPAVDRIAGIVFGGVIGMLTVLAVYLILVGAWNTIQPPVAAAAPQPEVRYIIVTTTPAPPCLSKQ